MKEEKMPHIPESQRSRGRRPQTAKWKIPKADARRESYSKSAQEPGLPFDAQSPITLSTPTSSLDNYSASEVMHLQSSNGTPREYYKQNNIPLFTHHIDGKLPLIRSSSDFHKTTSSLDGSSIHLHNNGYQSSQTYLTSIELKTPWYITVLHEKERCLLKLGEEINRLLRYEVECKKKDQIICTLKNDISQLRGDLPQETQAIAGSDKEDIAPNQGDTLNRLKNHEKSHFEGCPVGTDRREESDNSGSGDTDTYPERNPLDSLLLPLHASELCETRELIQLDTQSSAKQSNNEVQSDVLEDDHHIQNQTNSDLLDIQENLIKKLEEELENLKKENGISKGTIVSLQRIVSFRESQLRKTESEKEILQKHLKERVIQVQAMSAKFSSLREERKHAETMTVIEKENCNLRELVFELKAELAKRNDMIGDLKIQVQRLLKEVVESQTQAKKREDERSALQSKAEDLECSEQHVKVALEQLQSRFGRFRSKIIQAAFNAPGVKVPQTEISDHEALEAMQKIIAERSDYHQQLKQMGVKVPPLHSSENGKPASSAPKKNK